MADYMYFVVARDELHESEASRASMFCFNNAYLEKWNRELTPKCKLKCYVKPMKDPLGVSLTSVGIEPTTSGLDLPLLCRGLSYEVGKRKSGYD